MEDEEEIRKREGNHFTEFNCTVANLFLVNPSITKRISKINSEMAHRQFTKNLIALFC